jgi:anti-sigma B factor antagonist
MSAEPSGSADLLTVRLLGLPVQLQVTAAAHMDAVQREFDVLLASEGHGSVPQRLLALIAELQERYGGVADQPREELRAAAERGDERIDLTYQVPAHTADACVTLGAMLDEVDEYCRGGEHLMTLAMPTEAVAYRRWFLSEFVAQIGGSPPTSWDDFLQRSGLGASGATASAVVDGERSITGSNGSGQPRREEPELPAGWSVHDRDDHAVVRPAGEIDLQTAADLREVLQSARRSHNSQVVLDLGEVTFIDSVGLSVIIAAHQRLSEDRCELVVVVPPILQRLFEISGLGQLLELRT